MILKVRQSRGIDDDVKITTAICKKQILRVGSDQPIREGMMHVGNDLFLILAAGDARIDNRKFKDKFHTKAKMPTAEEVLEMVGHPVGGVCPFGINEGIDVYLDESLKRFVTVFPAVGSASSAIELNLEELYEYSKAIEWIDVCKLPEQNVSAKFN